MIDALMHGAVQVIRSKGYDERTCFVQPDGRPPPWFGSVFAAVHQGAERGTADNSKDDRLGFFVTLTLLVSDVPLDRVGDQRLAVELANKTGFNARCDVLADALHMEWAMLQDANDYLARMNPDRVSIYGFCEPARYRGRDVPKLVGGDWVLADAEAEMVMLTSELRFEDARRMQAIATYAP